MRKIEITNKVATTERLNLILVLLTNKVKRVCYIKIAQYRESNKTGKAKSKIWPTKTSKREGDV